MSEETNKTYNFSHASFKSYKSSKILFTGSSKTNKNKEFKSDKIV